jgi:hypothetical protein
LPTFDTADVAKRAKRELALKHAKTELPDEDKTTIAASPTATIAVVANNDDTKSAESGICFYICHSLFV